MGIGLGEIVSHKAWDNKRSSWLGNAAYHTLCNRHFVTDRRRGEARNTLALLDELTGAAVPGDVNHLLTLRPADRENATLFVRDFLNL